VKVKLDVETVPTVPDDPPAAGPDRALDPPPPDLGPPATPPAVAEGDEAVAEGDAAIPTDSAITAPISTAAAATIHPLLLVDSNRRSQDRRAGSATVAEAGVAGRVSWGVVGS
jgi:hypothetical protein